MNIQSFKYNEEITLLKSDMSFLQMSQKHIQDIKYMHELYLHPDQFMALVPMYPGYYAILTTNVQYANFLFSFYKMLDVIQKECNTIFSFLYDDMSAENLSILTVLSEIERMQMEDSGKILLDQLERDTRKTVEEKKNIENTFQNNLFAHDCAIHVFSTILRAYHAEYNAYLSMQEENAGNEEQEDESLLTENQENYWKTIIIFCWHRMPILLTSAFLNKKNILNY